MSDGVLEAALLDYGLAMECRRYPDAARSLRIALKCAMGADQRRKLEKALASIDDLIASCARRSGRSCGTGPVIGPGLDPRVVIAAVCRELGVTHEEVFGTRRHPAVVLARMVIFLLLRRHTRLSFPEIARATGRPNHSTVITGTKRLERVILAPEGTFRIGYSINPRFLLQKLELALGVQPSQPAADMAAARTTQRT